MPVSDGETSHFPTNKVIVIHPGSLYVRIGRASDLVPVCTPHCIARRRTSGGLYHRDPFLPPSIPKTRRALDELEESRAHISQTLQSCVRADGTRRYATPPQRVAPFNRRSEPIKSERTAPAWLETDAEYVVGADVLRLDPKGAYNVHFPYRRGDINLHKGVGGSLVSALTDLATIWRTVIRTELGVDRSALDEYRCVLLVPDAYDRNHLKRLAGLALDELGFSKMFLVQESVAATFGAGCGYACVVDVGDQKTAVSCVEDGISHKSTRLRMDYGAGDACQTLMRLLDGSGVSVAGNWNERSPTDAALSRRLYEDFCHIDLDVCGPQERTFDVKRPGERLETHVVQFGDECIVAPLSMFYPELLATTGPKSARSQAAAGGDAEDPFDADYLRETGRRNVGGGAADAIVTGDGALTMSEGGRQPSGDHSQTAAAAAADEDVVVDAIEPRLDEAPPPPAVNRALGLDAAVLQSVERCPSEELKRKMYGCVLIVGGGAKPRGLARWLQNRLALQVPFAYRTERMADLVVAPKETDPAATAWKGAAIMSCLESAEELWIGAHEWRRHGVKVLRERSPFVW